MTETLACAITDLEDFCGRLPSVRPHAIPRIVDALDDCGYLFSRFRDGLGRNGRAGIVAIHCHDARQPETTRRTIALFTRLIGRKLHGLISGGYRASDREFFLLLSQSGRYDEETFQKDMEVIRRELATYFTIFHNRKGCGPARPEPLYHLVVEGVFLTGQTGESPDNALFRAFQELFGAAARPRQPDHVRERRAIEEIVLQGLVTPVYQPIFSLADGACYGYEALSRITRPTIFKSPEELFTSASRTGMTASLETLCRKMALTRARQLSLSGQLFLNLSPTLLQDSDHERGVTASLLEALGIQRSRVTFELTEQTMIENIALFRTAVSYYRAQGYSIAIDDLGSGYAGLKMLAELEPDYVKLDRFLISGIDTSATRQALVESLLTFCNRTGTRVIAEGIERQAELDYLLAVGVTYGQGYLLGRPSPDPHAGERNPGHREHATFLHDISPAVTQL